MFAGGTDYEAGPYHVTIPKGEMSAEFCIAIINDTSLDGDEAFIIGFNKNALNPDVILTKPYQSTVTILDDECKHKVKIC